jgi:hypothetical protein
MKVLYNTRYGGFNFSPSFIDALFTHYPPNTEEGSVIFQEIKEQIVTRDEYTGTKNTNVILKHVPFGVHQKAYYTHCYHEGTLIEDNDDDDMDEDRFYMYCSNGTYYSKYLSSAMRSNQTVVNFALEYGLKKASGEYSSLSVANVPDGISWRVSEYDGLEEIILSVPYKDICVDLVNYIASKGKVEKYTCQFSEDIINSNLSLGDLLKLCDTSADF